MNVRERQNREMARFSKRLEHYNGTKSTRRELSEQSSTYIGPKRDKLVDSFKRRWFGK